MTVPVWICLGPIHLQKGHTKPFKDIMIKEHSTASRSTSVYVTHQGDHLTLPIGNEAITKLLPSETACPRQLFNEFHTLTRGTTAQAALNPYIILRKKISRSAIRKRYRPPEYQNVLGNATDHEHATHALQPPPC